jgi:hypothetical protein
VIDLPPEHALEDIEQWTIDRQESMGVDE